MKKYGSLHSDFALPREIRILGIAGMLLHAAVWYFWVRGAIPENFGGEAFAFAVIFPFALIVFFLLWACVAGAIYLLIYAGASIVVFDTAKRARIMATVKRYVLRFYGTMPNLNAPITLNTFVAIYFVAIAIAFVLLIADFLFGVLG